MGIMDLLLGRKPAPAPKPKAAPSTQFDSQMTQSGSSPLSVRKDLLKLVMRETLTRNGIPPTWLSAEVLRANSPRRGPGLHVRFLVREWEPRLLQHGIAFENEFTHRLMLLDPMARSWLSGFSWQFALSDTSACPALPHPSSWTAPPPSAPAPDPVPVASSYGDVIEGPPLKSRAPDDVRADLERLLALRDEDMRRHTLTREQAYAPTSPAHLSGP